MIEDYGPGNGWLVEGMIHPDNTPDGLWTFSKMRDYGVQTDKLNENTLAEQEHYGEFINKDFVGRYNYGQTRIYNRGFNRNDLPGKFVVVTPGAFPAPAVVPTPVSSPAVRPQRARKQLPRPIRPSSRRIVVTINRSTGKVGVTQTSRKLPRYTKGEKKLHSTAWMVLNGLLTVTSETEEFLRLLAKHADVKPMGRGRNAADLATDLFSNGAIENVDWASFQTDYFNALMFDRGFGGLMGRTQKRLRKAGLNHYSF